MSRSQGSVEFSAMPQKPAVLSARYEVAASTISLWKSGGRKPEAVNRAKIEADGGPKAAAWDQDLPEPEPAAAPLEAATETTVVREADRILRMIRVSADDIALSPVAHPDRVRQLDALTRMTERLASMVGIGLELSERQILASPNLRRIADRITTALEPWPEAMAAAVGALKELQS